LDFGYSFGFRVLVSFGLGRFGFGRFGVWIVLGFGFGRFGVWIVLGFGFGVLVLVLVLVFFGDYCNEAIHRASQTSHNIARVKKTSLY
jgi:uncharacterized membrane protein